MAALWSMVVGYAAGHGFFWRALGRAPGAQRDRDLREAVGEVLTALLG